MRGAPRQRADDDGGGGARSATRRMPFSRHQRSGEREQEHAAVADDERRAEADPARADPGLRES